MSDATGPHQPDSDLGTSFAQIVDSYDRGRPDYPADAIAWLTGGEQALTILELGAGTGKLTQALVKAGHDVHATDPSPEMLAVLSDKLPGVRTSQASAERLPREDRTVDLVIAAQCYHWFDPAQALPEIARVLKPGGHFSVVWNQRDDRIPWVRRFGKLIQRDPANTGQRANSIESLDLCEDFSVPLRQTFKHWQDVNRDTIIDVALSRSYWARASSAERVAKAQEVLAFYDDYGRGFDGMQMPYLTECYRAQVMKRQFASPDEYIGQETSEYSVVTDDGDDDLLLIDFR